MNDVDFTPSAGRHGITKREAMHAMATAAVDVDLPGRDGHREATLFIGHPHPQTDRWLEVLAELRPPRGIIIFHAMELTDKFRHFLEEG